VSTPRTVPSRLARLGLVLSTLGLASLAVAGPVGAVDAITLTTPYPAIAVAPGATPSFDITVKTATATRVGLTVGAVPDGWTAVLHGGGFTIDGVESPGGDTETKVTLNVTVPATASGGTQRIDVKGTGAGGASTTLSVDIRVSPEAAGDVALTTTVDHLQGASNASFSFSLTLNNGTPDDLPFSVNATGPTGWTVTAQMGSQAQAASVVVKAGQNETVAVTVKAATDASAGDYPISVDATSGSHTAHQDLAVTITGSYSLTLATADQRLNMSATAGATTDQMLLVTNNGTADVAGAAMSATAPSGWTVKFDPATVSVPAGQQVQVVAHVTPSGDAIAGDYVSTFKATAPEANASADIRVTIETSAFWGAIGIGLIALVLIALWLTFRRFGRR
jgi:uncharacterized membrane protein